MSDNREIVIISGNVKVKEIENPVFEWAGRVNDDRKLVFKSAYEIAPPHLAEGISNLTFRVHDREFKDLSFLVGETLQEYPDHYEIRKHQDGTKFVFSYSSIPTFDSGDREWDSICHIAVYADQEGTNMIYCRHGYAVPRIKVYIGLMKSIPAFTEWLERLGLRVAKKDLKNLRYGESRAVCMILLWIIQSRGQLPQRRLRLMEPGQRRKQGCGAPKEAPVPFGKGLVSAGSLYGA